MKKILLLLTAIFLVSCSQKSCTTVVELESGETIHAEYVQTFVSGMSNVKKCDGEHYQTNSNNIKSITKN
jgi:hypothetical protein